jgi:hypothetical protein
VFVEVSIDAPLQRRYAISNYGRLISFENSFDDGRILKGGNSDGYRTLNYKIAVDGNRKKKKSLFLYKLVAEHFIPKTDEAQCYVIHLDYVRDHDKINNLAWATREQMLEHSRKSPHVIAAKSIRRRGVGKLTSTQVIHLKKRLLDPNRKTRVKMLAKQFGVSEMQINRIRTGENWGHIKV